MNEDQINELKSLVDELTTQGLSTEQIQASVDQRKAEFANAVEITDETQTTPTEGKTNGAAEVDATVAPVATPSRASMIVDAQPESTELESVDTSGELQPNDQGYFRQERKKGRLAEDIRQDVYNASEQITKPVRKVDDQGEFVYGDQRDLNKQVADYKTALNDLINAKGQFENFANYTQEERLNLVDKVIAKPNYNKKVYNQNTDTYEIEPTKEFVSMVESHMPSDMEMYDTPEEWAQALNQGRSQAFSKDPVMRTALNAQVKLNANKVNEYQESLKDKYDFSNPETFEANLALANSDVDKYIQEEILVPFENSDLFKSLQTQYLDVSESILADKNKQYARAQHSFLDEGGLSEFALIEGTVKGVKQMSLGFNQADLSKFHGQVASINNDINKLQTEIDSGNLTLDSEITDPLNRRMKITVRERLKTLNDRKDNRVKRIVDKVGKISEKEEELGLFKEADFDNLTFEGAMIGLGEALPQVTAAGLTGLVSGGMGLAVIFAQEYGGNYYDAITKGLEQDGIKPTPENIAKAVEQGNYANRAESAAFAALQASLERVGATQVMKGFTKGIGLGTDFKKATSSLYKGEMKKFATQLPKKAKSVAMGGFSEALTEGAQTGLSQVSTAVQLDLPVATFIDPSEIKTAAQQGGLVGTILPFSGRVAGQSGVELRAMARDVSTKFNLRDAKQIKLVDGFFKEAESSLAGLRDQGIISKEEYSEQSQELANARNTGMKIPEYFSNQDKQRSYDLILERDKLEKEVKQTDKALAVEQLNNIETINEELNRIAKSQQPVAEAIAKTQQAKTAAGADVIAEQLGIKPIERYQTQEEVDVRKEELKKQGGKVSASASYGNAYTLEDGSTVIVINEQVAKKDNVYTTDQHEVLHPLMQQTFTNNPEAAIAFGKSLLEELNNNPKVKINNPEVQERVLQYIKAGKTEAETMEEVLNFTSEALSNGSITIEESTLTKIGNYIRKFLKDAGVLSIKFNSGKDVLNFVRDYNTTIEKGKGLGKAARAVASKGAKGKLVTEPTTETTTGPTESASLRTPKGQEFISLVDEGILTNESLVDVVKSPSSTQEDKFGAIEAVVEKNWPVISKAVKFNPTGSIPMDAVKEAVTEQIQGIFPGRGTALFDTYNPETSQVNTFIGSTLGPRQAEILERAQTIGGRTQAADITEARGIAAEEPTTPETDTRERKLIDSRTFGPAADVSIDNIVTIKQGEKPSFRQLAEQNLDEVSTKVFNVPGKKIRGKATLTDSEAKSLQRLFVDPNNVRKLIKTMPPYNVAGSETVINEQGETIDVSRDVKGKSIGLSTKFINKYYQPVTRAIPGISNAKGRSLGLTTQTQVYELKPEYTGRISNEVVKQIQNDVGVTEAGVPNQKISAENRSKYGTTLTGFSKAYLANAINAAGRGKQTTKQEQADTGAGKSRDAASLRKNRFEVSGKNGIVIMRDNAEQFANANKINIEFEGETINVRNLDSNNPKHRAYVQQAVENELWKYFPIEAIDASTVVGYRDGFYFTKQEWPDVLQKAKQNKAKWLERGNKLDYDIKAVKVAKGIKAPPKRKDYYSSDAFNNKLKLWEAGVEAILDGGANAIKANKDLYLPIFAVFSTQSQSSSHLVRNMSVEKGASEAFINATKGTKTVKEHVEPSNEMAPLMYEAMLFDEVSVLMPVIEKVYYQLGITKLQDDKTLDPSGIYGDPYNYKTTQIDEFNEGLREYFKTGDVSKILSPLIRYFNPQVNNNTSGDGVPGFNSNELILKGKTVAEIYTRQLTKGEQTSENLFEQNQLTYNVLNGSLTQKEAIERLDKIVKLKSIRKASIRNNNENNTIKFSEQVPNQEILDNLGNADKAMANARNPEAPVKKIRVFDFDDTLARSNSNVLYEMPDGTTGKLNATQFAQRAGELEEQGANFDFSEFSKVVDGKRGPVFKAIENIVKARGAEDVFILTARPADAAGPIKEFMDALGVNLPIENIVGLGDGKAEAKARWMTGKAAEGYNDFFFVDDAYKNVKAVQDALDVFDVKSKTQQARASLRKPNSLDRGFNDILENKTGIASEKEYGRVKAEVAGAGRGRLNFFIPPSAEDFVGLLYATLGKGKLGDQQMAWYKTHLLNPYARAMNELSSARIAMMNDYKLLKKQLEIVPKDLRKKVPGEPFTREQAVRVYVWDKQGMSIPGISKKDQADLSKYVSDNAELQVFADQLIAIQKGDQYAGPKEGWPAGTITTDMLEGLNTTKRAKYLEQWQANADVIFSEKNLNKLEAAYGKPYRLAMENMLQRMKSGRNRNFQGDTLTGRFTDWVTGSIGTIMFFNTRSAILQTISSINFINFTDNNVLAAGKAFANQKQYWSDFMTLMNSDFLKERRGGLRINVSEADIADMAKKGGAKGVINKLLEFGFTPTQIADSFAIASGGSAFYRNRIKSLKKQGMTDAEAEAQAFVDFRETAEESQQSSRPDRISMQQAGPLGRLVLAFANTPAQYARLIKKAASDLKNGRGDAKTNISKIIYYGVAQNLLFNALQQALFAFAFDDDEEDTEEQQKKYVGIANGMMDSLLRGMGLGGAVVSVGKNAIIRIIDEMEKKQPKLEKVGYELTKISPPFSSKLSRINQAARSYQWDKKEMKEKGWSLDNPAYLAGANVVAALTNVPLDRAIKKTNNVVTATSQDLETWERLALLGGWQDWEIGVDEEKPSNKPQPRKVKKKKVKKKKIKR